MEVEGASDGGILEKTEDRMEAWVPRGRETYRAQIIKTMRPVRIVVPVKTWVTAFVEHLEGRAEGVEAVHLVEPGKRAQNIRSASALNC